jgi:hypothetical protein
MEWKYIPITHEYQPTPQLAEKRATELLMEMIGEETGFKISFEWHHKNGQLSQRPYLKAYAIKDFGKQPSAWESRYKTYQVMVKVREKKCPKSEK